MTKKETQTMIKKIILGTLMVGLIGILVAGAIIRTVDKTDNVAEARELERGNGYGSEAHDGNGDAENGSAQSGQGRGGSGQGLGGSEAHDGNGNAESGSGQSGQGRGGSGQGLGGTERQYPSYETPPEDWVEIEGTVAQAPADGQDLVIETYANEEITVGTGPGYMETQGFALQAGEQVKVLGYWEDGEFKAAQVTRLQDGQTITLRDQVGRPAWAGGGRGAQGGYGGEGNVDAPGEGTSTGQAEVDEWLTIKGTVVGVDSYTLLVQTEAGKEITLDGRTWSFAQESGISAQIGDEVILAGFYEGEDLEVGRIDNVTTGQTVSIREEGGRPLWAGRGQRGS
jgi:hypothetical protein